MMWDRASVTLHIASMVVVLLVASIWGFTAGLRTLLCLALLGLWPRRQVVVSPSGRCDIRSVLFDFSHVFMGSVGLVLAIAILVVTHGTTDLYGERVTPAWAHWALVGLSCLFVLFFITVCMVCIPSSLRLYRVRSPQGRWWFIRVAVHDDTAMRFLWLPDESGLLIAKSTEIDIRLSRMAVDGSVSPRRHRSLSLKRDGAWLEPLWQVWGINPQAYLWESGLFPPHPNPDPTAEEFWKEVLPGARGFPNACFSGARWFERKPRTAPGAATQYEFVVEMISDDRPSYRDMRAQALARLRELRGDPVANPAPSLAL